MQKTIFQTKYQSKRPDARGCISYSDEVVLTLQSFYDYYVKAAHEQPIMVRREMISAGFKEYGV